MRKKWLTLLFAIFVLSLPVLGIVGGRSLDSILLEMKGELRGTWGQRLEEQQRIQREYENQHERMLGIIRSCNELAMGLYLQQKNFTFDVNNALYRVTREYNEFSKNRAPYDIIVRNLDMEIDRYARFMEALRRLPPELKTLDVIPDSLSYRNDSLDVFISHAGSSLEREVIAIAMADSIASPFVLSEVGEAYRDSCLLFAGELLKVYAENRATVLADSLHYQEVFLRLKESYDYAAGRYEILKKEIFVEGQLPWWEIASNYKYYRAQAAKDAMLQYGTERFDDDETISSENADSRTRNTVLLLLVSTLLLGVFFIWAVVSLLLWLLCKIIKPLGRVLSKQKRPFVSLLLSVVLYFMLFPATDNDPYLAMAMRQIATFFWLLAAILGTLLIRLRSDKIRRSFSLYLPSIFMAFSVVFCRISFMPNLVMNITFPPTLIIILVWQLITCLINGRKADKSDRAMSWAAFAVVFIAALQAFLGYIFLALMVLVWWYSQLAAIHTLVTIGHLMNRYRDNRLQERLRRASSGLSLVSGVDKDAMLFKATWFYDLVKHTILPILSLASVPLCIYFSLNVFDFDDLFRQFYQTPFIQVPGNDGAVSFRISIESALQSIALFFVFRYANKAFHAIWQRGRYNSVLRRHKSRAVQANEVNLSLGNSLISVGVWFLYAVSIVSLLNIPTGSLALVAGGLSAGIGLALKDIINNFIYGIQLMSGRLRVGDWIECEGVRGQVVDINYQSTQVLTVNDTIVSFLNATLFSKSFTNLSKGSAYEFLKILVGVPYGSDVEEVRKVLESAMEVMKTKDRFGRDVVDPRRGIYVRFAEFGDSSVVLAVKQYVLAAEHVPYFDAAREVIYDALKEAGITIPFPQRDIHIMQ